MANAPAPPRTVIAVLHSRTWFSRFLLRFIMCISFLPRIACSRYPPQFCIPLSCLSSFPPPFLLPHSSPALAARTAAGGRGGETHGVFDALIRLVRFAFPFGFALLALFISFCPSVPAPSLYRLHVSPCLTRIYRYCPPFLYTYLSFFAYALAASLVFASYALRSGCGLFYRFAFVLRFRFFFSEPLRNVARVQTSRANIDPRFVCSWAALHRSCSRKTCSPDHLRMFSFSFSFRFRRSFRLFSFPTPHCSYLYLFFRRFA